MKVNVYDPNKIEILLSSSEIEEIFGGYDFIDYNIPACRAKINSLFAAAVPEMILPLNCSRVFIEVKPQKMGCSITFTKVYNISRRYKRIKEDKCITLIFSNSDNLISATSALSELDCSESELYTNEKEYAIIATVKHYNPIHISEYCKISKNIYDAERIKEYWRPVCKKGAVLRLKNAFLK